MVLQEDCMRKENRSIDPIRFIGAIETVLRIAADVSDLLQFLCQLGTWDRFGFQGCLPSGGSIQRGVRAVKKVVQDDITAMQHLAYHIRSPGPAGF